MIAEAPSAIGIREHTQDSVEVITPEVIQVPEEFNEALKPRLLSREEINFGGLLSLIVEYWREEYPNYPKARVEVIDGLTGSEIKITRKVLASWYHSQPNI